MVLCESYTPTAFLHFRHLTAFLRQYAISIVQALTVPQDCPFPFPIGPKDGTLYQPFPILLRNHVFIVEKS